MSDLQNLSRHIIKKKNVSNSEFGAKANCYARPNAELHNNARRETTRRSSSFSRFLAARAPPRLAAGGDCGHGNAC